MIDFSRRFFLLLSAKLKIKSIAFSKGVVSFYQLKIFEIELFLRDLVLMNEFKTC